MLLHEVPVVLLGLLVVMFIEFGAKILLRRLPVLPFSVQGGKRRWWTRCRTEPTHPPGAHFALRSHPSSVLLCGPGRHWRLRGCDTGFLVNLAPIQNPAFHWALGSEPSTRQAARTENNILSPFSPLSSAHWRVFICCTDLPFDFNLPTAGKSRSVKIYNEELDNPPL